MKSIINKVFVLPAALIISLTSHIAIADVAVIVHPSNASALDLGAIKKLFLGKSKRFPSGDTAFVVVHAGDSKNEFNQKVLSKSASQIKAYWAKRTFSGKGSPPTSLSGDAEVKSVVSSNANTIGYIDASQVDASVKVLFTL